MKYVLMLCCTLLLISCVHTTQAAPPPQTDHELLQFAKANCFFWYFQKKGYATQDIQAISGGIVELGSASPEKYEQVTQLVKNYRPQLATKQNVDIDLLKCFAMEEDAEFLRSLAKVK